jgi:hypothetical protein
LSQKAEATSFYLVRDPTKGRSYCRKGGKRPLSYDDILKRLNVLAAKKRKMKKVLPGRREDVCAWRRGR